MRLYHILLIACLFCFHTACIEDDNPTVQETTDVLLNFKAVYGEDPLIMESTYTYPGDSEVQFKRFQFYISNINLLTEQDNQNNTEILEVDLIDFSESNVDPVQALEGIDKTVKNVPLGEYTGIRFGIGVPADLNRTTPIDYGSEHPLGNAENYLMPLESYVFSKIEGQADINQDGAFNHSLIYHNSRDQFYKTVQIDKPITIEGDFMNMDVINFNIDLRQLFIRDGLEYLDIINQNIIYEDPAVMQYFVDNLDKAITIE